MFVLIAIDWFVLSPRIAQGKIQNILLSGIVRTLLAICMILVPLINHDNMLWLGVFACISAMNVYSAWNRFKEYAELKRESVGSK
ncbi:MAG: hypothetical protein HQ536_05145 [Parcubacteria group bacterium]|nr:hypothetical protein [Parcubacteria group bacterium]